jgi:uncharacterized protein
MPFTEEGMTLAHNHAPMAEGSQTMDPMSPRILQVRNETRSTMLCQWLEDAGGLAGKSRGLLGRKGLEPGHGMLFMSGRFEPFMWMHMFFMHFAIDIVFLDRDRRVIRINHRLKPWRVSSMVFGARTALELAAGDAARSGTMVGDRLTIEEIP